MSLSTCDRCGGHIPLGPNASNRCESCGLGVFEPVSHQPKSCTWAVDDDGIWQTQCGNAFYFEVDGPHENKFKFCPYCGSGMDAVHAPDWGCP